MLPCAHATCMAYWAAGMELDVDLAGNPGGRPSRGAGVWGWRKRSLRPLG